MDKFFYLLFIKLLSICFMAHGSVILSVNQHVKRYSNVKLNCTSDTVPHGQTARIDVNGKSYTAITFLNGECFSTVLGKTCTPDVCTCSRRGLWYSHTYKIVEHEDIIEITCSMIFELQGEFSDSITVNIIDFTGPTITTVPMLPFPAGIRVKFICEVNTLSTNIKFKWDCLDNAETSRRKISALNSTKYFSIIMHDIHLVHDEKSCICCINVNGITAKSEVSVRISRKPVIDISNAATCRSSAAVTLFCIIRTEFRSFGFNYWIHSRHGTLIRHLTGKKFQTKSVLTINPCSFDDFGNYTCVAYNRYRGEKTFANKTVSLLIYGPPTIKSTESVKCNSSSVTLSCIITTGLPTYGFSPWIHSFNGNYIRTLNGSMHDIESVLEFKTCSYQDTGDYTCTAWNKYGNTSLVTNKTISLFAYASPVIISSGVFQERQTTLSASVYSLTEITPIWLQSNQTITNSSDLMQTIDRQMIELVVYNQSIEIDGYIANLSIRSSLVGEYVLFLRNTFGETKLIFDVDKLNTPAFTASFDLRVVVFGIITLGIFILTATATVIMTRWIQRNNVIHIIGPHERCPTIPIYHSAPALDTQPNVYDTPETGYLQAVNDQYELDHFQDTEIKDEECYFSNYISSNYDEIDI